MHYLLLVIGIIVGLYGLYRFFLAADMKQITAFIMTSIFIVICAALFFLAVTGRLPAALGLLAALWPFAAAWWHKRHKAKAGASANPPSAPPSGPMSRKEALSVLGLDESADEKAIKEAYKKLIKKTHPDQEGSQWLAAKINQAKDTLLKK